MTSPRTLPYGRHSIAPEDVAAVVEVLERGALTAGPEIDVFEADLARAVDAPYAVSCATGTAALHLAGAALGVGPGFQVIVPTLTFLATANAMSYLGAEVVFADVDPETGLMRPQDFEDALAKCSPRGPVGAIPVHLNGQVCDMAALGALAERRGVLLLEDACHAIGSVVNAGELSDPVGSARRSGAVCFSFHAVKTVAMGEGGAVTTRSAEAAEKMRLLRSHGMVRQPTAPALPQQGLDAGGRSNPWYYEMPEMGWNYRLTGIQAALGRSQLRRLPAFVEDRRRLVAQYDALLRGLNSHVRPVARAPHQDVGWHLYVVLMDFTALGLSRADVMRRLAADGVGTQVHYLPVHRQPYYMRRYGAQVLPGADAYYDACLTLPLFPGMSEEDVHHVVAALQRAIS